MTIQLPADIYSVIAKFIDDPTTYLNFLLSSKLCYQEGSKIAQRKRKAFFLEVWREKGNIFTYERTTLYKDPHLMRYLQYQDASYSQLFAEGYFYKGIQCGHWKYYSGESLETEFKF